MNSLKDKTKEYLKNKYPLVVHKGEIEKQALLNWQYEGGTASRKCRELENEKEIIKVENKKGHTLYQWSGDGFDKNIQLKALLYRIQASGKDLWENREVINDINDAIKSTYPEIKDRVIQQYKEL